MVGENQVSAPAVLNAKVAAGPYTVVCRVVDHGDLGTITVEQFHRFIGGTIVDHHKLEVDIGLRQRALNCFDNVIRAVVHTHQHTDIGPRHLVGARLSRDCH